MSDDTKFNQAVEEFAKEDGAAHLITIPGVWECLLEYYNNAAIDKIREDAEDESNE